MDPRFTLALLFFSIFERGGAHFAYKEHGFFIVKMECFGLGGFFPRVNKENHVEFFAHVGFLCGNLVFS